MYVCMYVIFIFTGTLTIHCMLKIYKHCHNLIILPNETALFFTSALARPAVLFLSSSSLGYILARLFVRLFNSFFTYFGHQRFGYCFPGLLFLGSNPMKCLISPWSRYSMSRCCYCNHQAELGFLFSHGFLAWSG